jgi:hypothetical protein
VESNPLLQVADTHGVEFPEPCLLYNIHIAPWALSPSKLLLPAPPQDTFGVLTSAHVGADDSLAAARRLLSDAITTTLVVNGQQAMTFPVTYDASAGPQLLSVSPSVISAAMPEVCLPLAIAYWICPLLQLFVAFPSCHGARSSFWSGIACAWQHTFLGSSRFFANKDVTCRSSRSQELVSMRATLTLIESGLAQKNATCAPLRPTPSPAVPVARVPLGSLGSLYASVHSSLLAAFLSQQSSKFTPYRMKRGPYRVVPSSQLRAQALRWKGQCLAPTSCQ